MRILFLNQYFPPDPAPTGVLLRELGSALEQTGATVEYVSAGLEYRAGQQKQGGRMRRELGALGRILWAGLRAPRADVVISATSPPCLLVVATVVMLWHRARGVHWLMDLYPELAVSLREVPPGWLARAVAALMGWCYRRQALVVVLDEDMAGRLRGYGVAPRIIRPWVFEPMLPRVEALRRTPPEPGAPWTWIYSGNLGRAHEWATLLEAQEEIERRDPEMRLLFQGGGPARAAAQARAGEMKLQRCAWRDYVPETEVAESLLASQACVVTQLPEAQGLLWPSKLGLLLSLPRPIAWVGVTDGAIARELRKLPQAGVFAPGQGRELAEWLLGLKAQALGAGTPAIDPAAERARALGLWREWLAGFESR